MGDETDDSLSLRYWSGRSEERRRRLRTEAGADSGRNGNAGDELVGGVGPMDEGADGGLLPKVAARTGARRRAETGAVGDVQGCEAATSLLLGQLHPIWGVVEPTE